MDSGSTAPYTGPEGDFDGPSSSAAMALRGRTAHPPRPPHEASAPPPPPSRYESQKRRDWNTFLQYLRDQRPPLALAGCGGTHVIEFLRYLDQFGKTKVHAAGCAFFGRPTPPAPCACPLRQAWGSLDALIGRLRAAFEESGGKPEANPFAARAVRFYLREVRESQAKARGVRYEKKKRKRAPPESAAGGGAGEGSTTSSSSSAAAVGGGGSTAAEEVADAPTSVP